MSRDGDALAQTLADALADETVHVAPEAQSRVPTPAVEQLEAQAQALPYPVRIAIVEDDAIGDSGRELVEEVHDRVGSDGVYLVTSPRGRLLSTVADDGSGTMDGAREAIASAQGPGSGYEGVRLVSDALEALAEEADVATGDDGGSTDGGAGNSTGTGTGTGTVQTAEDHGADGLSVDQLTVAVLGLGVLAGAAVFAAVGVVVNLRAKRLARPPRYRIPGDLLAGAAALQREGIRQALSQDTLDIAARLRDLDTRDLSPERAEEVRRGLDAYTFAGRLVDAPDATRADLAGALVLLTAAGLALEHAEDGTRASARETGLCTVDPTHGDAVQRRRVGVDRVRMPVCGVCVADVTAGRTPDWLHDRGRPYPERDTVWARTRFGASGEDLVDPIRAELVARRPAD